MPRIARLRASPLPGSLSMRRFHGAIAGLALLLMAGFVSAQAAKDRGKKNDAATIAGAQQVGRFPIGIASNMDLVSTAAGPRIVGLDGLLNSARPNWAVWHGETGKVLGRMANFRPNGLVATDSTSAVS